MVEEPFFCPGRHECLQTLRLAKVVDGLPVAEVGGQCFPTACVLVVADALNPSVLVGEFVAFFAGFGEGALYFKDFIESFAELEFCCVVHGQFLLYLSMR